MSNKNYNNQTNPNRQKLMNGAKSANATTDDVTINEFRV